VDQAVEELSEELRLPVILHFLQGHTQTEVADELGVNQSTISRRIEKGVEELRAKLAEAGVVVSAAVLPGLLLDHAVIAAPASLLAALGKLALSGFTGGGIALGPGGLEGPGPAGSSPAAAAGSSSAGLAGASVFTGKIAAGIVAAAAILTTVTVYHFSRPSRPAKSLARKTAATSVAPDAQVQEAPEPERPPPSPFSLAQEADGLETGKWAVGNWGNPITYEILGIEGRGKVLKANCQQGRQPRAICSLSRAWSAREYPFLVFDVRYEFDHEVPVAVGVTTTRYFESSVRRPAPGERFTRVVYDLSQANFKEARYNWAQGVPIDRPESVKQLFILCFPQKKESTAGVLFLDRVQLAKGVFTVGEEEELPFEVPAPQDEVFGDFNNDGVLDALVLRPDLALKRGNRDGSFVDVAETSSLGRNAQSASWTDLDHNGTLDLLVLRTDTGSLDLLLGDGAGTFSDATHDWVLPDDRFSKRISAIHTYDRDEDGDDDLAFVLDDGSHATWQYDSPHGLSKTAALSVHLAESVGTPQTVVVTGTDGKEYGARLLRPHRGGRPGPGSTALYHLPPGTYTARLMDGPRETAAVQFGVSSPRQRLTVSPQGLFPLYQERFVKIDGLMSPGEWDTAPEIERVLQYTDIKTDRPESHPMTIRYHADRYGLYLCVRVESEDFGDTVEMDILTVYLDNDGDGELEPGEDVKAVWAHIYNDYYMLPPEYGFRPERDPVLDGQAAVSHTNPKGIGDYIYEMLIPWHSGDARDLNLSEDADLGIKITYVESIRKGFSWRWKASPSSGFPDGRYRDGKTYAKVRVSGLSRQAEGPPGEVKVSIEAP